MFTAFSYFQSSVSEGNFSMACINFFINIQRVYSDSFLRLNHSWRKGTIFSGRIQQTDLCNCLSTGNIGQSKHFFENQRMKPFQIKGMRQLWYNFSFPSYFVFLLDLSLYFWSFIPLSKRPYHCFDPHADLPPPSFNLNCNAG